MPVETNKAQLTETCSYVRDPQTSIFVDYVDLTAVCLVQKEEEKPGPVKHYASLERQEITLEGNVFFFITHVKCEHLSADAEVTLVNGVNTISTRNSRSLIARNTDECVKSEKSVGPSNQASEQGAKISEKSEIKEVAGNIIL